MIKPSVNKIWINGKGRKLYINIRITYNKKRSEMWPGEMWLHKMVNVLDMNNFEMCFTYV